MQKKSTLIIAIICGLFLISSTIDLTDLLDYSNQAIPNYINEDNTPNDNPITDAGATLGRVLFYDKKLSINNTISCASCHKQDFAFGDTATVSIGWNGETTGRHSPRLINARFGEEENFFWDERASSLEEQSTMPIQDHVEMGFSNINGNPGIDSLITKLEELDYYQDLFTFVYGDFDITEAEIQDALAQFVRSIQSFDSKFDIGRAQVNNNNADFPNFTTEENLGKTLFLSNTQNGGANCNTCHNAPEFDIDSNSDNNSVVSVAGDPGGVDVNNTRSPTLRDMVNPDGTLNGPLMHDGSFTSLLDVIDLYDDIPVVAANTNLDNRLNGQGNQGQNLNLTDAEKDALVAFLGTLTGVDVYTNAKWSDPFEADGSITVLLNGPLPVEFAHFQVSAAFDDVLLEWSTASERDNRGFEIQHSSNAINWEKIGFVDGMGDTQSKVDYSFVHENPNAGINYYRLKQMDWDDKIDYSNTLSQYIERQELAITAYPNPVLDRLQVDLPTGDFTATVLNAQGRVLRSVATNSQVTLNFSDFNSGIYFLVVKDLDTNIEQVEKIVKQ